MESELPCWFIYYNREEHELRLSNYHINIDKKNITINEIQDIIKSKHIDH